MRSLDELEKLLYWRGIAANYFNYRGEQVAVPLENRMRLLEAMGVEASSDEVIREQAYELDVKPWLRWVPAQSMTALGPKPCFEFNARPEDTKENFRFVVTLEDKSEHIGQFVPSECPEIGDYVHQGQRYSRRAVPLPADVPLGYHQLSVGPAAGTEMLSGQLVVYPPTAYTPKWAEDGERPFGIIVQLYTLRSQRNWGIGDFTDLMFLIEAASARGVDMIGLNPLHALRTPVAAHCSPYSPSDRRFLEPLYIDPAIEPEYAAVTAPEPAELAALRAEAFVPYERVAGLKYRVLEAMFAVFEAGELSRGTPRAQEFERFLAAGGEALAAYCEYAAAGGGHGNCGESTGNCGEATGSEALSRGARFAAYLQWLAANQLDACQTRAQGEGMRIGLMRDLAVGADGGGAEVVTNDSLFCRAAAVGAPPDPLAEKGQNWGLPPMDPATLRSSQFRHFIDLLSANMHHCGALRIDHAMSLMRLWWCPPGQTADYGAYVYYPFRELLGLLNLESQRNNCLVIGEDMGVVPPEFREALTAARVFTNKLFYFEKTDAGEFKPPSAYERSALAMLNNHDVPTLASWWCASDISLRERLDLLEEGADVQAVYASREAEKSELLEWLAREDLVARSNFAELRQQPLTHELASIILRGASRAYSQLYVIQLEDLELQDAPVNVPGTSYQYPNWQRKLTVPLETLFADPRVTDLLGAIASERRQRASLR